jgi:hypothetical protein
MALEDAGYPFVGGRVCHTTLRKVAAEMPTASWAAASAQQARLMRVSHNKPLVEEGA